MAGNCRGCPLFHRPTTFDSARPNRILSYRPYARCTRPAAAGHRAYGPNSNSHPASIASHAAALFHRLTMVHSQAPPRPRTALTATLPPARAVRCGGMSSAPGGRRDRRPEVPLVVVYCIGAIAILASAGRTLTPKQKLCLSSTWCISLSSIAQTYVPKPRDVKFVLHTLPVDARAVTDGDTITVYVNMADHLESGNLPHEVHEVAVQRAKAWAAKNYDKADALQKILLNAGYRQVPDDGDEQVLVKKYWIRLSGIDAPESSMPYGKEAKQELVRLVQGKVLKIHVYDSDRYGRLVGDVDCDGVFVQEHMLKKGLAWHYTAYDHRIEMNKWQNQAKKSRTGLWALSKPEKPWEWRKKKHIGAV